MFLNFIKKIQLNIINAAKLDGQYEQSKRDSPSDLYSN